jgi:tRNA pseudouridine55 synthase
MPTMAVDRNAAGRLRRGQAALLRPGDPVVEGEVCALDGRDVVALCSAQAGELRPVRVFRAPRRRITVPIPREAAEPTSPAA